MRVTKKVENYIREQVRARVMPKYEAEKAEVKRITDLQADLQRRAAEAAKQAAIAILSEAKNNADVLDYNEYEADRMYMSNLSYVVTLKDRCYVDSVHHWSDRMRDEVNKIVDDIIVTLELGGNKADLDRMLSEL
jgi:hypothetical protein